MKLSIVKTFSSKQDFLDSQELVSQFKSYENHLDAQKEEIENTNFICAYEVQDERYDYFNRMVYVHEKDGIRFLEFIKLGACVKSEYVFTACLINDNHIMYGSLQLDIKTRLYKMQSLCKETSNIVFVG